MIIPYVKYRAVRGGFKAKRTNFGIPNEINAVRFPRPRRVRPCGEAPSHPLPASGERVSRKGPHTPLSWRLWGMPGHDYEEMVQYDRPPDYFGSAASCGTSSSF